MQTLACVLGAVVAAGDHTGRACWAPSFPRAGLRLLCVFLCAASQCPPEHTCLLYKTGNRENKSLPNPPDCRVRTPFRDFGSRKAPSQPGPFPGPELRVLSSRLLSSRLWWAAHVCHVHAPLFHAKCSCVNTDAAFPFLKLHLCFHENSSPDTGRSHGVLVGKWWAQWHLSPLSRSPESLRSLSSARLSWERGSALLV